MALQRGTSGSVSAAVSGGFAAASRSQIIGTIAGLIRLSSQATCTISAATSSAPQASSTAIFGEVWYREPKPLKPGKTRKITKSPIPSWAQNIQKKDNLSQACLPWSELWVLQRCHPSPHPRPLKNAQK